MQQEQEIKLGLKVHHRDAQGRLIAETPYTLHIQKGTRFYEAPKSSGNLWYEENGLFTKPAGRIVAGQIDTTAKHIEYAPPKVGVAAAEAENQTLKQKMEALEAELSAIKKEKAVTEKAQKLVEASTKDTKKGN